MKTTKFIFALAIILLLSFFATGCIPTVPGGSVSPRNTFNVNFQESLDSSFNKYKMVIIDGDSLLFRVQNTINSRTTPIIGVRYDYKCELIINSNTETFEILKNGKKYRHINTNEEEPNTNDHRLVNTFNSGELIDDNLVLSYFTNWQQFTHYTGAFNGLHPSTPFASNNLSITSFLYLYNEQNIPGAFDFYNGLHFNTDEYIVLRKLKGSRYQYYWIKVKLEGSYNGTRTLKITNGKYQLDNITTGL